MVDGWSCIRIVVCDTADLCRLLSHAVTKCQQSFKKKAQACPLQVDPRSTWKHCAAISALLVFLMCEKIGDGVDGAKSNNQNLEIC